jgi:prolycopene isomerase
MPAPPIPRVRWRGFVSDLSAPWDVVVIGSGIGGLVTATQLAAKGAKVLVLERYLIPGGSGGSFRRDGYTFDVGASMIFGFGEKGHTNLLTRALADVGEHCDTIPDPVQLEYHLPGGLSLAVDRDYDTFIDRLTTLFPHEATAFAASTTPVGRCSAASTPCRCCRWRIRPIC